MQLGAQRAGRRLGSAAPQNGHPAAPAAPAAPGRPQPRQQQRPRTLVAAWEAEDPLLGHLQQPLPLDATAASPAQTLQRVIQVVRDRNLDGLLEFCPDDVIDKLVAQKKLRRSARQRRQLQIRQRRRPRRLRQQRRHQQRLRRQPPACCSSLQPAATATTAATCHPHSCASRAAALPTPVPACPAAFRHHRPGDELPTSDFLRHHSSCLLDTYALRNLIMAAPASTTLLSAMHAGVGRYLQRLAIVAPSGEECVLTFSVELQETSEPQ